LRERLGLDDIILVLQKNRLHWYWRVLQCMEYEVEGASQEVDQCNGS